MSFFEQISLKNSFNASLNTNMWQVYTRPTSASDFFFQVKRTILRQAILRLENSPLDNFSHGQFFAGQFFTRTILRSIFF
jgi:hypothetical protein